MTAPKPGTPGQAAREAFGELGADWYPGTPWNKLHADLRAQWEAAATAAIIAAQELQPAPDPAAATDIRPREGERGWHDVTCGACGEEFGTNFRLDEIECAECEARRCPQCHTWFGAQS